MRLTIGELVNHLENLPAGLGFHMGATGNGEGGWVCIGGLAGFLTEQGSDKTVADMLVTAAGVSRESARMICYPDSVCSGTETVIPSANLGNITTAQAADLLRHFVATGVVDWGRVCPDLAVNADEIVVN